MTNSHRIWWLIAFCALGIGIAIDADAPGGKPAAQSAAAPAGTVLALQPRAAQRG
jgi:hypothetical protein